MLPIAPRAAGNLVELHCRRGRSGAQGAGTGPARRCRSGQYGRGARGAGALRASESTSACRNWRSARCWPPVDLDQARADLEAAEAVLKRATRAARLHDAHRARRWPDHPARRRGRPVHPGRAGGLLSLLLRAAAGHGRGGRGRHPAGAGGAEGGPACRCLAGPGLRRRGQPRSRPRATRSRAASGCASGSPTRPDCRSA